MSIRSFNFSLAFYEFDRKTVDFPLQLNLHKEQFPAELLLRFHAILGS